MQKQYALRLSEQDTVATVLEDVPAFEMVTVAGAAMQELRASTAIPQGHKIALTEIQPGVHVIKYGASIGVATAEIPLGAHVHIHNLASTRGRGDL